MNTTFIVNFVGQASPSTIKQLAAVTHENGGKWLLSKVNFIENHVAAVIKIELPKHSESVVKEAFSAVPDIVVQFADADTATHNKDEIFHLRVDANDRAGIVNDITHVLDGQGVNILDMDCQRVFIADGGGVSSSLFCSDIVIRLPANMKVTDIVDELEALSEDTKVLLEED